MSASRVAPISPTRRDILGKYALVAVIALFSVTASAQGNMRQPLSASERATLARGEVVVRPTTERRGPLRLFGGTSYIVVDLPPEAAWGALNDSSSRYRHMLPQVAASRELSRSGDERVIRFEHNVAMISAAYALRFQYNQSNKTIQFRLASEHPHDIRAAWGFFRVRPYRGGRALVSFGAMLDVGDGLLTGALQERLHEWVLKIPWTFKRYIEGSGRRRYTR